jgi:putative endonuclease
MFKFYVLKSLKDGKLYKGFTEDIEKRIIAHNQGRVKSTRSRHPFKLLYSEEFDSKAEALKQEKHYKTYSGGIALSKKINKQ